MPSNISLVAAREKNLIASDTTYLVMLEVDLRDASGTLVETLYLVNNTENVTRNTITYTAFPFSVDLQYEAGGQPSLKVMAQDITLDIQSRMQSYGGGVGSDVRVLVIHQDNLDGDPELIEYFKIMNAGSDDHIVNFTLGTQSMLGREIPRRRQLKDRCSWRYKSAECGYTGGLADCDYTLNGPNGCSAHNNTINFGGFPGLKSTGMRYV